LFAAFVRCTVARFGRSGSPGWPAGLRSSKPPFNDPIQSRQS
jgi:hypothetical protein